jgi:hypothetical protein
MPQVSLAKALKIKNRLTGRLNKTTQNIQRYNSTLESQAEEVDVKEQLTLRERLRDSLITLKVAIFRANLEIQETILALGEAKSEIQFYGGIDTTDGDQTHHYQNTPIKYVAVLKRGDVDAKLAQLETTIDTLQDKLDEYNVNVKIEIPQTVLDLAS